MHGFSRDNTWCLQLDSGTFVSDDGALAIDGVSEGVDNTAEKTLTDGHIDDRAGSLDDITFLDLSTHAQRNKLGYEGCGGDSSELLTYRYPR